MASITKVGKNIQKVFVGNLPWTVGHPELRAYFEGFGRVISATVVFDKKTGHSKGFGFVAFKGIKPIEKLEGEKAHLLEGNYLAISKSHI